MSFTVIVLLIELAFILLGGLGFLLFLRWKRKKTQTEQFGKLLDEVAAKKDERESILAGLLQEKYAVASAEALESATYMVEAEKQFLQQFLTQQVEQTPITDFYQNLCGLLDQYTYFIPAVNVEDSETDIDPGVNEQGHELEVTENEKDEQDQGENDALEKTQVEEESGKSARGEDTQPSTDSAEEIMDEAQVEQSSEETKESETIASDETLEQEIKETEGVEAAESNVDTDTVSVSKKD